MSAVAVSRARSARRPPLLLTAAALLGAGAVTLPLAYLGIRAATAGSGSWRALQPDRLGELLARTGALVGLVTVLAVAIGVPLAWLVARSDLPWRRFWAVAAALPLVIPSYVAALVLVAAFGPRGMLQGVLEAPFGVERVPEIYGLPGATAALVLSTYPYVYLLTVAALHDVDPSLEEASRNLGRSARATFRKVTLPVLRPAIAAGALLVALYTLSDFGAVSLMQYDSLTRAIFVRYQALFDRNSAAVLALALVALTTAVLFAEVRARGRARVHRTSPGAQRRGRTAPLGRWRWPAFALCALVVGLGLLGPLSVLGWWAVRAASLDTSIQPAWGQALGSLGVSGLAATAAILAALPVVVLSVRHPGRWTRGVERVSYVSHALPGIVVALSLVFFGSQFATPLYQTLALLVFAYVVRFYAQAVAGSRAALVRVDARLEEAGRGLGRAPLSVFARVTAPLLRPGLLAAAALVFLSTMKELPATLLLRPIGFDTLATEIWTATSAGFYSRAAVPALVLIVASAPFVYLLAVRGAAPPEALD